MVALASFGVIGCTEDIDWPISSEKISVTRGFFQDLLRIALAHIDLDERYYLTTNRDVAADLERGLFQNAKHHFTEFGYFEGRLPYKIAVDEEFYLSQYPDIAVAVRSGDVPSAQLHFERSGYREGRLPSEGWTLLTV